MIPPLFELKLSSFFSFNCTRSEIELSSRVSGNGLDSGCYQKLPARRSSVKPGGYHKKGFSQESIRAIGQYWYGIDQQQGRAYFYAQRYIDLSTPSSHPLLSVRFQRSPPPFLSLSLSSPLRLPRSRRLDFRAGLRYPALRQTQDQAIGKQG